jgi:hypothetical protein
MKRPILRPWLLLLLAAAAVLVLAVRIGTDRVVEQTPTESYPEGNYTFIEDGLCVGGILDRPPPGIETVLNVCETEDPYKVEVHRWEPMLDLGPPPSLDWLREQVEFIDRQRKAGRPILVHCRAGINRSVTVVAAYLMWRDGLSRDEALEIIANQRPRIGPFQVYLDYLAEWEELLKQPKGGYSIRRPRSFACPQGGRAISAASCRFRAASSYLWPVPSGT